MCSSDAREIYHIHRISRKTHHSISLNPLLLSLHAALEFLRLKVLAHKNETPICTIYPFAKALSGPFTTLALWSYTATTGPL